MAEDIERFLAHREELHKASVALRLTGLAPEIRKILVQGSLVVGEMVKVIERLEADVAEARDRLHIV